MTMEQCYHLSGTALFVTVIVAVIRTELKEYLERKQSAGRKK